MVERKMHHVFFDGLRQRGDLAYDYLKLQGGSDRWIKSLMDRVQNASGQEFDQMKADLLSHYKAVDAKHEAGIKDGMMWSRSMPKNISKEMANCKICKEGMIASKTFGNENWVNHVIDMHPNMCLYIGNGTDMLFNPENVKVRHVVDGKVIRGKDSIQSKMADEGLIEHSTQDEDEYTKKP